MRMTQPHERHSMELCMSAFRAMLCWEASVSVPLGRVALDVAQVHDDVACRFDRSHAQRSLRELMQTNVSTWCKNNTDIGLGLRHFTIAATASTTKL
jgi:hypothetical protein